MCCRPPGQRAIGALSTYEDRGVGFAAWLFAIARNECRERWRTSNHEIPLDAQKHDIADERSRGLEDSLFAQQILIKLSEDDRELLRLRYIGDLSMSEIANVLKINSVAVRVRIHRALAKARMHAISHQ